MHGNGVGTRPTEISKRHTYVRMCTRSSARHEFSFHGWRDNPSLCHFSSVFLSHRLIELPSPGEIPVTYVLFSVPFFFILVWGWEEIEASSSHLPCISSFPEIWYLDRTEISFLRAITCTKKRTVALIFLLTSSIIEISTDNRAYSFPRNSKKHHSSVLLFRVCLDACTSFVHYISANYICLDWLLRVACRARKTNKRLNPSTSPSTDVRRYLEMILFESFIQ